MLYRKWESIKSDVQQIKDLQSSLGVGSLLAKLFVAKGADTTDKARELFLEETVLSDPYLLKDMDIAVDRINTAIDKQEKIVIYGDYDVDGICATATLFTYLESVGANVYYKIPNREKDGYGLNSKILRELKNKGVDLVITVDNGIAAVSEVEVANEIGLDVIITDHHLPKGEIPKALAVIDPLREDDDSPCKTLCGAGVAFKLVCAIENADCMEMLDFYADFVAVGTVADLMLLEGENRTIVKSGLSLLNQMPRQGFESLIEVCGLAGKEITSESIAYAIAPRINAAGRMTDPTIALELMISEDVEECQILAQQLEIENQKRQETQNKMVEQITENIVQKGNYDRDKVIVVWADDFHAGVVGIVASKLVEMYAKPAIVLTRDGVGYKGSGRSVVSFNLHKALEKSKEFLTRYGGHELAAGLSLEQENLENFRKAINDVAKDCKELDMVENLKVDCVASFDEITVENVRQINCLAPFGNGNPLPLFMIENLQLVGVYPLREGKHIRLKLKGESGFLQGVMFNISPADFAYNTGDMLDIVSNLSIYDNDMGSTVSIKIKEVRPAGLTDEVIDSFEIYKKYKSKKMLSEKEKHHLCPLREDVALVYRYILQNSVAIYDMRPLFAKFTNMPSGKVQIIVDILVEQGLIEASQINGKNAYVPVKVSEKRDLSTSVYIRDLKS